VTIKPNYFHLHLISDSTGETLLNVGRAAAAQYGDYTPIEHMHPLIRTDRQLDRTLIELESAPGIVLYTIVSKELSDRLERFCREQGLPCVSVLAPIFDVFRTFLNVAQTYRVGAQHDLDAGYFKRIEALNFMMAHDDGQLTDDIDESEVIILGVSRTSKTPTSIYLANRGVRTSNVPIVPGVPLPQSVYDARRPLIVGLVASPERIAQIRENRILALDPGKAFDNAHFDNSYIDRQSIAQELAHMRRLCSDHGWPMIDVTRRSIEETAAAIIALQRARKT
jgi:regulator of PEP synthase PpsR (kinase-PPPase family)